MGPLPPTGRKEMTGLEFVQGLVDATLPLNTIAETLGYDITDVASGRVIITAEPNETHLNPVGTVHGGFSATLLDSCMGLGIAEERITGSKGRLLAHGTTTCLIFEW
jgi:acyl-coenzyme A thioesterase PaaI-like protein